MRIMPEGVVLSTRIVSNLVIKRIRKGHFGESNKRRRGGVLGKGARSKKMGILFILDFGHRVKDT